MEELEIKKLKKRNKILFATLLFIIVCILGVTIYAYFIHNNSKNETPVDVSKLTENIDYQFLLNKKNITANELSPEQMFLITYRAYGRDSAYHEYELDPSMSYSDYYKLPTTDLKGISYPDYSKETQKLYCNGNTESYVNVGQVKNMARYMNMDVSKIEKMDTSLFACYGAGGGSGSIYALDSATISSQVKRLFGTDNNIFDKTFHYYTGEKINNLCGYFSFIYDKNIDTFFLTSSGGCTVDSISSTSVVKEYYEDGLYKMDIVEYMMGTEYYENDYPKVVKIYNIDDYRKDYPENGKATEVGTITINNDEDKKNVDSKVLKYKDKLSNYTLTFKMVDDYYQFVSIDYIK